jgi:hypothetical protein
VTVVLYGCENMAFILREGRELKVFANKEARGLSGPERERK